MKASSGGIGIDYLEKQPFARIAWMSRMAEAFLLQDHLSNIYAVNLGYSGEQKKLDRLQQRLGILLLEEPKTDKIKLKKWKDRMKVKKKKRKRVKLNLEDK